MQGPEKARAILKTYPRLANASSRVGEVPRLKRSHGEPPSRHQILNGQGPDAVPRKKRFSLPLDRRLAAHVGGSENSKNVSKIKS